MQSPPDLGSLTLDPARPRSVGAVIRSLFGSYERQVADAYRALYFNIDTLADKLHEIAPNAQRILEVGCGEGALTQRLPPRFPQAKITAIDITPRLGRLFWGDATRVEFIQATAGDISERYPGEFDLIVMSDVLHHVPLAERKRLLRDIRRALALGASFVLKDWARSATPIHWLCHASDRYLTGDDVRYASLSEARSLLEEVFGADKVSDLGAFGPWKNNISFRLSL